MGEQPGSIRIVCPKCDHEIGFLKCPETSPMFRPSATEIERQYKDLDWLTTNPDRRSSASDRSPSTNALWKQIRANLSAQARQFVLRDAKTKLLEKKVEILDRQNAMQTKKNDLLIEKATLLQQWTKILEAKVDWLERRAI